MLLETTETYYWVGRKLVIDEDRQSELDYSLDLTAALNRISDTFVTCVMVLDPLLTQIGALEIFPTIIRVWLKFATPPVLGHLYPVTYRYVTQGGRHDDRTFYIKAVEK